MHPSLIQPVHNLIKRVENDTNKPIRLVEVRDASDQNDVPTAQPASSTDPSHEISYDLSHPETIQCQIAHECAHILRTYDVPTDKRMKMERTSKEKETGINDLAENKKIFSDSEYETWYEKLLMKLRSAPEDLWVDNWLLINFHHTEIHNQQIRLYIDWATEISNHTSDVFEEKTPTLLFKVVNAIDYASYYLLRHQLVDADKQIGTLTNHPKIIELGDQLIEITRNSEQNDHEDDIRLIDNWAEILRIQSWYHWEPRG